MERLFVNFTKLSSSVRFPAHGSPLQVNLELSVKQSNESMHAYTIGRMKITIFIKLLFKQYYNSFHFQ